MASTSQNWSKIWSNQLMTSFTSHRSGTRTDASQAPATAPPQPLQPAGGPANKDPAAPVTIVTVTDAAAAGPGAAGPLPATTSAGNAGNAHAASLTGGGFPAGLSVMSGSDIRLAGPGYLDHHKAGLYAIDENCGSGEDLPSNGSNAQCANGGGVSGNSPDTAAASTGAGAAAAGADGSVHSHSRSAEIGDDSGGGGGAGGGGSAAGGGGSAASQRQPSPAGSIPLWFAELDDLAEYNDHESLALHAYLAHVFKPVHLLPAEGAPLAKSHQPRALSGFSKRSGLGLGLLFSAFQSSRTASSTSSSSAPSHSKQVSLGFFGWARWWVKAGGGKAVPSAAPTVDGSADASKEQQKKQKLGLLRGFRVSIGITSGARPEDITTSPVDGRKRYGGSMMAVAKALCGAAPGGMILMSDVTFGVLPMESVLKTATVVHMGCHDLSKCLHRQQPAPHVSVHRGHTAMARSHAGRLGFTGTTDDTLFATESSETAIAVASGVAAGVAANVAACAAAVAAGGSSSAGPVVEGWLGGLFKPPVGPGGDEPLPGVPVSSSPKGSFHHIPLPTTQPHHQPPGTTTTQPPPTDPYWWLHEDEGTECPLASQGVLRNHTQGQAQGQRHALASLLPSSLPEASGPGQHSQGQGQAQGQGHDMGDPGQGQGQSKKKPLAEAMEQGLTTSLQVYQVLSHDLFLRCVCCVLCAVV